MKHSHRKLLAIALFCAVNSAAWAGEEMPNLQPGLWEIISTPNFPNIPVPAPAKYDYVCLTDADIKAGKIPVRLTPSCKILGGAFKGQEMELKVDCPEFPDVSGKLQLAGKSFTGQARIVAAPGNPDGTGRIQFTFAYQAKWNSECPKEEAPRGK